jgi:ribose transport system ATP-binding protein
VLYQELNVVDDLTVEENLTLGKERHLAGFIWRSDGRGEVERILRGLDASIRLSTPVRDLSVAQKQLIEIPKVVSTRAPAFFSWTSLRRHSARTRCDDSSS